MLTGRAYIGNPTEDANVSVNEHWSNFKVKFMDVANLHAPLLEKRVRGNPCPWSTGEIKRVSDNAIICCAKPNNRMQQRTG